MSHSSIRIAIAVIGTLLSISITNSAAAASYKKCFKRWAYGYDKITSIAIRNAIIIWQDSATSYLSISHANYRRANNRQTKVKLVDHKGEITRQASVYGELCKNSNPGTMRNPGAGRKSRMPSLRYRQ